MVNKPAALLERARKGDMDAFAKLFEPLREGAVAIARRMVGSDAEDMVMEAYLKAWQAIPTFGGRSSVKTWLYRIVRNCCLDLVRARKRSKERLLSADEIERDALANLPDEKQPAPDQAALSRDLAATVQDALAHLPDEQRIPLQLRYSDGFTYAEIAAATGVTIGTVMSRLFYGKRKLKQLFEEDPSR